MFNPYSCKYFKNSRNLFQSKARLIYRSFLTYTVNEKSSLLRSSVTTQEIRYDYSSSPSRHVGSSPKYKELEWQHEFGDETDSEKDKRFLEYTSNITFHDIDSGIESNSYDESGTISEHSQVTVVCLLRLRRWGGHRVKHRAHHLLNNS